MCALYWNFSLTRNLCQKNIRQNEIVFNRINILNIKFVVPFSMFHGIVSFYDISLLARVIELKNAPGIQTNNPKYFFQFNDVCLLINMHAVSLNRITYPKKQFQILIRFDEIHNLNSENR